VKVLTVLMNIVGFRLQKISNELFIDYVC